MVMSLAKMRLLWQGAERTFASARTDAGKAAISEGTRLPASVIITLNKYVCSTTDMKRTQIEKMGTIRGQGLGQVVAVAA